MNFFFFFLMRLLIILSEIIHLKIKKFRKKFKYNRLSNAFLFLIIIQMWKKFFIVINEIMPIVKQFDYFIHHRS